jgi:predicted ATPase
MSSISTFAIRSTLVDLPKTGEQQLDFGATNGQLSTATILIGRNGSGKSTLLRELCTALRGYSGVKRISRSPYVRLKQVSIEVDGDFYQIYPSQPNANSSSLDFFPDENPTPRRVIALSFTPFDRFPVRDDVHDRERTFEATDPSYVYLGFKSGVRVHSPTRRLLNSIDDIAFHDSSPQHDERVAGALEAIGYGPVIRLRYRLSKTLLNDVRQGLAGRVSPFRQQLLERYAYKDLIEIERRSRGIHYTLDFGSGRHETDSNLGYDGIRELVRERVLIIDSILLTPHNSTESIDLLDLSSGELNILSGFLGLAAYLTDGCLVLIDEPENSLHPEWQVRYVSMLDAMLRRHTGCHYVIATHSPLIVSGAADNGATVLRLDQSPASIDRKLVAEESPDSTLVTAFDVVTPGNSFIRQIVLEAMTLIETDRATTDRAREISTILANAYKDIGYDDPIKSLAKAVVTAISESKAENV